MCAGCSDRQGYTESIINNCWIERTLLLRNLNGKEVKAMRKGLIATLALILVLGLVGYTVAQYGPQNPGHQQMGPMGGQGMMGGGMGMMGGGMGMMGPMMDSPQMMGTMMSIRGEMMTLMGEMMQKYGGSMGQMTPELRRQMQQQMMERMGEILIKHGRALKERAKAADK
jgi:hypothetical protein